MGWIIPHRQLRLLEHVAVKKTFQLRYQIDIRYNRRRGSSSGSLIFDIVKKRDEGEI